MSNYGLGDGFGGGYGSGGLGLGGGYGGTSTSSGLGLGNSGGNNYGGGWGGGYSLGDGYTGSTGVGLNAGNASDYGSDWGYSPGPFDTGVSGAGASSPTSFGSFTPDYSFSAPFSSGLGLQPPGPVTPSFDGSIGLKPFGFDKTGYGLTGEDNPNPSFWDSEFGKNLRKMGLFALRVHPATRTPMAIYGALNDLSSGRIGQGIGGLVGTATGNPGLAGLFGLGIDAARGQPVNSQLGSRIGGMAGAYTNGPVGAALGSMVGQRIGQGMDAGQGRPAASKEGSGTGSGDVLGAGLTSLAALYMANRQRQTAQQQQQQQLQQAQVLQDMFAQQQAQAPKAPAMRQPNLGGIGAKMEAMFGANSQTALALRKQLERKDAAAGRRSQYGPREVELLARLSQLRAQAEPGYMNAEISAANAANQHAAQMFSTQQQAYNNYIQNMMRGQQLGGMNQSSAYQAQQAADAARQQQLAALLYGARETGLFNAIGDWFGG